VRGLNRGCEIPRVLLEGKSRLWCCVICYIGRRCQACALVGFGLAYVTHVANLPPSYRVAGRKHSRHRSLDRGGRRWSLEHTSPHRAHLRLAHAHRMMRAVGRFSPPWCPRTLGGFQPSYGYRIWAPRHSCPMLLTPSLSSLPLVPLHPHPCHHQNALTKTESYATAYKFDVPELKVPI